MIQETHVSTFTEAEELKADWRRLWGRSHQSDSKPLSYWSIDDSKRGGVAILLHPSVVDQVSPWLQERWTRRVIAIKMRERTLVNVYAPNSHEEREQFFGRLQAWPWEACETIVAGDFNCVLSPVIDRLGGHRTGRPESAALPDLLRQLQLEDTCILAGQTGDGADKLENTEYFTYWGPEAASRIDRFYVPASWTAKVQWLSVLEPTTPSDHQ
ncbi:hypothetical protein F443_07200 [Phytophthora nicotianae P1569]|uniref:Endonuclease/exonuclease/phosphatase domain-containing protein n=1 Tax=Phytophthora nicotianae P1569 TaxID=1317065 RepID=V9FBJ1_PHYNI|nr:hypothetical protein F443_07200 [Phytophthora nicotianae P1569]